MNILLIDPDTKLADEMLYTLSQWGIAATHADTAVQAINLVKRKRFSFVLLELFLKESMGYEIIPDLKLYSPGIKIIAMAQNSTPELIKKTREYGIVVYMEKPIPQEHLLSIFNQHKKQIA